MFEKKEVALTINKSNSKRWEKQEIIHPSTTTIGLNENKKKHWFCVVIFCFTLYYQPNRKMLHNSSKGPSEFPVIGGENNQ